MSRFLAEFSLKGVLAIMLVGTLCYIVARLMPNIEAQALTGLAGTVVGYLFGKDRGSTPTTPV